MTVLRYIRYWPFEESDLFIHNELKGISQIRKRTKFDENETKSTEPQNDCL
jgi:hypothetical protein